MSRGSELARRLAVAGLLAAGALARAGTVPAPTCGGGVCSLNVDSSQAVAPCEDAPILLAWRQGGGATLIQCATSDAPDEQPSLLFDSRDPAGPAFELQGTRFFTSDSLPELAKSGVPDRFASHDLCRPPQPSMRPQPGDLLLLRKIPSPSNDEKNPYCFLVSRFSTTAHALAVHGDDADLPKPDTDHGDWNELAKRMLALIPATAAPAAPAAAGGERVLHARAPLRDRPDAAAPQHGYLVQGDAVTVLDRSHAGEGWLKIHYVGKGGRVIDRWARTEDLAPAP